MSEPKSVTRNKFALMGRVESLKKSDTGVFVHEVTLPATDEYSGPQLVELRASRKVAEKGEEITVPVSVRGFIKSFKYTDRESGEVKTGKDARAWFSLEE